jgi:chaperone required for assembly of F1-ATPase
MNDESEDERWERLSQDRVDRPLPKKFYKLATVGDDLSILLDGRAVKTPLKVKLVLPNAKLAQAVAVEWNAQEKLINPALMPLTKLANTAIDRAGPERDFVAGEVESFAANDLVCYRADAPTRLIELQNEVWDPVVAWANKQLNVKFKCSHSIRHVAQDDASVVAIQAHVAKLDHFQLTAVHNLTSLTGSALIALMLQVRATTPEYAWAAAHVDEDFQINTWGQDDEAAHRRKNRKADFDATLAFLNHL